jgi:hypothetical protein
MASRFASAALLGAVAVSSGCSKDPEYDRCNVERPAFLVRVRAGAEELPADLRLQVEYGAGKEEYVLAEPPARPDVMFCTLLSQQVDTDAMIEVDAGSAVRELLCELWTQGGADLTVRASGYPTQVLSLEAERDSCGIETVDYVVVLERPDAGR